MLRAEEALRGGDLQRVQREPTWALRVRPGLLQHHVRAHRRVQGPAAATAALEARAEHPGGGCCGSGGGGGVQGLREPERRGSDGLVPTGAAAVRVFTDQGLDGEALLAAAVMEHGWNRS